MNEFIEKINWEHMFQAIYETLYMTSITTVFTFILGLLIGLLLFLTAKDGLYENKIIYRIVSIYVNIFRAVPFIILIILLIPFTKFLIGTMLGAKAALPALIIGSVPFYGRMAEIGFREVDKGVIEAAKAMGANTFQIIYKVLLPEAMPALVSGITVTSIMLVGYTAMAGVVGAGGLGNLAYLYGYQRNNIPITIMATLFILFIVFIIQYIGDLVTNKIDKR